MRSIVTEYEGICAVCGRTSECEHHLIPGIATREICEKDGLKIPMCNRCHNLGDKLSRIHDNPMAEKLSKMLGQAIWEKQFYKEQAGEEADPARVAFTKRYGRSYL